MSILPFAHRPKTMNSQAGFTLVELLIVMGIFGILLTVLTNMFVSVLQVQIEAKANASVTQDGRFLLSRLDYDIRRAASVTVPEDLNVVISNVTATSATVSWTTTAASNSRVEYGTTTAYGSTTTLNPALVTAHSVGLSGLTAGATYHFRTLSQEADGTLTTSADYVLATTGSTITHIQTAANTSDASFGAIGQAFSSPNTAGNTIIAAFSWGYSFAPSCSDSQGNTYTVVTNQFDSTNSQSLGICYASNIKAGANTVTVTLDGDIVFRRLIIHEYSGIASSNPVDVSATNIAVGTTAANNITSTAATTTTNGCLIFGATMDDAGTTSITAGTGFTQRNSVNNKDLVTQDRVQATAGSIASTMTFGTAHRYLAHMVAFKAAAVAGSSESLGASSGKLAAVIGGVTNTYSLAGGNLQLTNNLGTSNLNSSDTSISNLSFQRVGNPTGKETIRISFTVTSRSQPDQGARSRTFTITAGRR